MALEDNPRGKGRIFATLGIGIAALMGAYQFATETPKEGVPSTTMPVIFVVVALVCFALAGWMGWKLRKDW